MKLSMRISGTLQLALFSLALVALPSTAQGQTPSDTASTPRFVIRNLQDGIQLTCEVGCAWRELAFAVAVGAEPIAVDEFGMSSVERLPQVTRSALRRFLFTIRRTADGVELQGLEGFAWTRLGYGGCPSNGCNQAVTRFGMGR